MVRIFMVVSLDEGDGFVFPFLKKKRVVVGMYCAV